MMGAASNYTSMEYVPSAPETSKVPIAPDGKIADVLASTLACATVANAPVNYSRYVPQTFKSSHRPNGKIADVLASTLACTTAADAPVNYSLLYVPQRLKISIARCENALIRKLLTRLPQLTLAQLPPPLRSTTVLCTCCRYIL